MPRTKVTVPDVAEAAPGLWSNAIRAGDTLYISGQVARPFEGGTGMVGKAEYEQTRQIFSRIERIVKAAGGTMDDIVKTTVYLLDGQDRSVFLDAYGEQFRRRLRSPWMPAGLTMTVDALRPDCLVEIDAVAWLGAR